jgi:sugar/nucleoside kinase (ribokinase family)
VPLDAVGAKVFSRLTEDVDLLFCTLDEGEVLCGTRTPATLAARLTAGYPQVVLKLGPDGATWAADSDEPPVHVPAAPAAGAAVDSTGAGDAFAAAYLASTCGGGTVERALVRACALGALLVTREGTRPTAADVGLQL